MISKLIPVSCGSSRNLDFRSLAPLTVGLPKIVVLSDIVFTAVERLCVGFMAAGLDFTILCLSKTLRFCAPDVQNIWSHIAEVRDEKGRNLYSKYMVMTKRALTGYPFRPDGLEANYIDIDLGIDLAKQPAFMDAGLVLSYLPHGLVGWESNHENFSGKPVVWRMSGYSPFTGYCLCAAGCKKWKTTGCADCPQLGPATDGRDLAADNFSKKMQHITGLNVHSVTFSNWLGRYTCESLLFKKFPQTTIPSSTNLDVYTPSQRDAARSLYNLPHDRKMILFGAGYIARRNKGFQLLCQTLDMLRGQWRDQAPILCFFGKNPPLELLPDGYAYADLGYLDDVHKLAAAYAAADVFVSPSFEDNLPRTVNEALSCGTPVVCFNKYSSEDVVLDGVTGYTAEHPDMFPFAPDGEQIQDPVYSVPPERLLDFAAKLKKLLELPEEEYLSMRGRCREHAENVFSPVLETARYLRLFRKMLNLPPVYIDGLSE